MDKVNPEHYKGGRHETIEVIEDSVRDSWSYLHGNVIKYACRAEFKGDRVNDLKKAQWYLQRLIDRSDSIACMINGNAVTVSCSKLTL